VRATGTGLAFSFAGGLPKIFPNIIPLGCRHVRDLKRLISVRPTEQSRSDRAAATSRVTVGGATGAPLGWFIPQAAHLEVHNGSGADIAFTAEVGRCAHLVSGTPAAGLVHRLGTQAWYTRGMLYDQDQRVRSIWFGTRRLPASPPEPLTSIGCPTVVLAPGNPQNYRLRSQVMFRLHLRWCRSDVRL
jgi:hypothetical protein